eukprot:COSAG01_NODE_32424_length_581_cov_4.869295_1_plen_90_part_01
MAEDAAVAEQAPTAAAVYAAAGAFSFSSPDSNSLGSSSDADWFSDEASGDGGDISVDSTDASSSTIASHLSWDDVMAADGLDSFAIAAAE